MVRIKKVSFDGVKVLILYDRLRGQDEEPDEYSLRCKDEPVPAFKAALAALSKWVVEICELPAEQLRMVDVRGVSFSWAKDKDGVEVMGATISALKRLGKTPCPLVLNTPHLPETPYGGEAAGGGVLPKEAVEPLMEVLNQAVGYVNGIRAQGQLSFETPAAPEKHEGEKETPQVCRLCGFESDTLVELKTKKHSSGLVCPKCFDAASKTIAGGKAKGVKRASRLRPQKSETGK